MASVDRRNAERLRARISRFGPLARGDRTGTRGKVREYQTFQGGGQSRSLVATTRGASSESDAGGSRTMKSVAEMLFPIDAQAFFKGDWTKNARWVASAA